MFLISTQPPNSFFATELLADQSTIAILRVIATAFTALCAPKYQCTLPRVDCYLAPIAADVDDLLAQHKFSLLLDVMAGIGAGNVTDSPVFSDCVDWCMGYVHLCYPLVFADPSKQDFLAKIHRATCNFLSITSTYNPKTFHTVCCAYRPINQPINQPTNQPTN
jgi:hypothetical protein